MYYNPHRVSRIEAQAFQMIGDKVQQKVRTRQPLDSAAERDTYWRQAVQKAQQEVRRA